MESLSVAERDSAEECLRAADWVCVTAPVVESMVMVKTLLPAPLVLASGAGEGQPVGGEIGVNVAAAGEVQAGVDAGGGAFGQSSCGRRELEVGGGLCAAPSAPGLTRQ